jgi:glyoxylase-like metal-dependent hydrolase (beta-lactamase superfamily II)
MRPWPRERVAELGWRIDPPRPTRLLVDGDTVELGGRTLRVIHTPGHAPDHICLLDEAAGILFAQDQAYYGPLLVYEPGTDPATYARSAGRVHGAQLRPSVPPRFLGELADAAEAVAAGEARLSPARGMLGEPVLGADFGHFSILVSPEFAPRPLLG